jgi:hypothetical protein
MKRLAIFSIMLLALTACSDDNGSSGSQDIQRITPPTKATRPSIVPGAEVVFTVTNTTLAESYAPPFHIEGNVVIPRSVDVGNDLRLYTGNFIPEGRESLSASFIVETDEEGLTNGTILGGLGEYGDSSIPIRIIGDWQASPLDDDRAHLFINLDEDALNQMATENNLLWPNE